MWFFKKIHEADNEKFNTSSIRLIRISIQNKHSKYWLKNSTCTYLMCKEENMS